jgi:hypothetical protein
MTMLNYRVQITCLNQLEVNTTGVEKFLTFGERLSKALYPGTYMDIDALLPSKTSAPVQTGPGAYPASDTVGTGGKAAGAWR